MKAAQPLKSYSALLIALALACIGPGLADAAMISINPSKDNTLYEYVPADGDRSNGAGFHFFTGTTAGDLIRRGVIAFDIAGNIPPGSTITGVSLSMNMSLTIDGTGRTTELHKLPTGAKGHPTRLEGRAAERRLLPTTRRGGTVSTTRFFGLRKAATFPPPLVQASRLASLGNMCGVRRR